MDAVHSRFAELFGAQDRVLERFGCGEAQSRACRNLDHLSGRGIAAHPRLALALAENSQARQAERTFLLQLAKHQRVNSSSVVLACFLVMPTFSARCAATCVCVISPPPCTRIRRLSASLNGRSLAVASGKPQR